MGFQAKRGQENHTPDWGSRGGPREEATDTGRSDLRGKSLAIELIIRFVSQMLWILKRIYCQILDKCPGRRLDSKVALERWRPDVEDDCSKPQSFTFIFDG